MFVPENSDVDRRSVPRSGRSYAARTTENLVSEQALDAGRQIIAVRGELDLLLAPDLDQKLKKAIAAGKTGIVIDLTETSYLDESGLNPFMNALKALRRRGGVIAVAVADPNVAKIFEITMLHQVFRIRGTRDDAIAALDEATTTPG